MRRPLDPLLYLVTDTAMCRPRTVADVVRAAVAGGVTAVQVRDKHASSRELLDLAVTVRRVLADRPHVALLVNDDVEVAVRADADGVHVGQDDLPADEARCRIGPDRLLGLSVGSDDDLRAALALPAGTVDLVGLSPVWPTPTKPDAPVGLGLAAAAGLARAAHAGGLLAVAIGGIHAANAASVRAAGVDGVCVVSDVCGAADPADAARALRAALGAVPAP